MKPASEAELAEIVKGAREPLRIQGGGTRPIGVPVEGAPLSVAGITGVELYEPGALTLVARAGTPVAEVEEVLAAEGQRLAFEPMDHRGLLGTSGEPTIGGVFAANVSGPRRIQCGAARDFLLGVRFVDGRGEVIRNGGRVMKNVTGYDLVKLMAGSYGTLGVLTEVALKVLPASQTQGMLMCKGLEDVQAVAALARALGSPFEVTGAAHVQQGPEDDPLTLLRIEGSPASVTYRAGELRKILSGHGDFTFESDAGKTAAQWRAIRDVAVFHGRAGDVWRLSVKPSDAPELVARAGGEALYDWGGGLAWVLVPEGTNLRSKLGAFAGHATLLRASEETRRKVAPFEPEPAPVAALSAGLRQKCDPRDLLNPGLMVA